MFDYISTVSGGGYIGGWWSAWLSRNRIELRRKARSVKFKVDHIKSPAHLAVSLRFPETRISEYIFKKLNAGTQDLLKKHCVPKAAPPSHLSHVLERALSEEPEFKFFESLPEDAKRYLKHYCRPDRAASEALAKVLVYELNELLKDPSILQNILKSGRVVEQLLDDSELMEFLRSLPYQNSDSCVVPVSEEREIVERWAEKSGAPGDEEKRLKQDEGYNSLSLLNQIAANIKTLNDQEEEGNQITWDIQWINRSLLETIYPNEIGRDIFPPPEKTELQRQSDYASDINSNHNGSTKQSAIPERKSAGKDPIHHLRLYANYLTPRKGILSGDTWRLIAVAARNLGLTWLIMLPMLFAILLAGQLYFVLQENPPGYYVDPNPKNTLQGEKYAEYRRIGHRIKIERALINQLLDSRAMCLGAD
jgi:hypothetical protein